MRFLSKHLIYFLCIYLYIVGIFLIAFGEMDIYYMYLILIIINSLIGMLGFVVNISTLTEKNDKIYRDLSKIFGIVGVMNLLFAIYVMANMQNMTYSQETQITLLNFVVPIILYMSFIYTHINEDSKISFNKILIGVFLIVSVYYIIVSRFDILPDFNEPLYSPIRDMICLLCIVAHVYLIINEEKLKGKFINDVTVVDIQLISACRIGMIVMMIILGGVNFYNVNLKIPMKDNINCLMLTMLNFVYVYLVYSICFRDIIKRPNQILYNDLLAEKKKLQTKVTELKVVSFNMEYYKSIYEELLKNMPEGIVISFKDEIKFANKKMLELLKLDSDKAIVGKTLLDFIDEDFKEKYIKSVEEIGVEEDSKGILKTKFSYNDISFEAEEIVFFEFIKNKVFKVSIINSIEDQLKLESARRELELRNIMDKARNEVLSNISHEFKTPVNVIYSTVQIQDLNLKNENYQKIFEFNKIIKQNCNRLIRLINNFIDSTKLEQDKLKPNLKLVNIVYIIEDVTMSVLNFANKENIELVFDTDEEELYCEVDIEFLERIMLNLLSNAIKYNKKNGKIDVIIKSDDDNIFVEVTDTGIGIPKERIDNIFNRFERVESNEVVVKKEGSGIGLNIVKNLIKSINGNIEIESVVNEGTTVRIALKRIKDVEEEVYFKTDNLEEKVNLEMSDIS